MAAAEHALLGDTAEVLNREGSTGAESRDSNFCSP